MSPQIIETPIKQTPVVSAISSQANGQGQDQSNSLKKDCEGGQIDFEKVTRSTSLTKLQDKLNELRFQPQYSLSNRNNDPTESFELQFPRVNEGTVLHTQRLTAAPPEKSSPEAVKPNIFESR